jgi:glutathione S-transferase
MLTLYQADWCPFSSAVRGLLTELRLGFVARRVEPRPNERARLRELAGTDEIPVLQADDGGIYRGTHEIFVYLRTLEPWPYAAEHRQRYADHEPARHGDVTARILDHFE